MTLKVKVNEPHFQYEQRESPGFILGANLVILAQTHYKLSCRNDKFRRILSQMVKIILKVNVNDPYF